MRTLLILTLAAFLPGCSFPASERRVILFDDHQRSYRIYVPPGLPDAPVPVVLVFHGRSCSGRMIEKCSRFDALAAREMFIAVYPDSWGHHWNEARDVPTFQSRLHRTDDVAFVAAVLDDVATRHRVDPRRVYATGLSSGGLFCYVLASRLSHRIAAIAPVCGGMTPIVAENFRSGEAVAVQIHQGTWDPWIPYWGGRILEDRGEIVGTWEAAGLWVRRNGCIAREDRWEPDVDPDDGCRVHLRAWSGGRAPVEILTIHGGGHTWSGEPPDLSSMVFGLTCRDFDATERIWEFFRKNPKGVREEEEALEGRGAEK